jgi:hypothetical protein
VFSEQLAQRRHVEHRFRQQLLQLGVLFPQSPQALGVRHIHPAIFGTPFIELASLMPCFRHSSAADSPASCSFKIPMI